MGKEGWKKPFMKVKKPKAWAAVEHNAQCLEKRWLLNHSRVTIQFPPHDPNWRRWCLLKGSFTDRKNKSTVYTSLCLMQIVYLNLITWGLRWFLFPPFFLVSMPQLWFALYQRFVHFKMLSSIKIKCFRALMISLWWRVCHHWDAKNWC